MSKRAESAARNEYNVDRSYYPEISDEEFYRLQQESIIRKHAFLAGYEQAEKDIIERACVWLFDNFYNYDKALRHSLEYDFRKAMEEE